MYKHKNLCYFIYINNYICININNCMYLNICSKENKIFKFLKLYLFSFKTSTLLHYGYLYLEMLTKRNKKK